MQGQALPPLFQKGVHPPFGKGRLGGILRYRKVIILSQLRIFVGLVGQDFQGLEGWSVGILC